MTDASDGESVELHKIEFNRPQLVYFEILEHSHTSHLIFNSLILDE